MRCYRAIGAFLCFLAIWVQFLAPVAALTLDASDPLGNAVICSHTPPGSDGGSQDGPAVPGHHHCLLCQAFVGGGLIAERPAFTALDYPIASPLRWHLAVVLPDAIAGYDPGQPRGPPALV